MEDFLLEKQGIAQNQLILCSDLKNLFSIGKVKEKQEELCNCF